MYLLKRNKNVMLAHVSPSLIRHTRGTDLFGKIERERQEWRAVINIQKIAQSPFYRHSKGAQEAIKKASKIVILPNKSVCFFVSSCQKEFLIFLKRLKCNYS